jgi:hypothetical protein
MHLNLSADEVLKTTRSVRKRLDFDKPVEREIVEECLYCLSASLKVSRIERIPGNSGNSHEIAEVGDAGGKLKIYRLFYVGYQ